MVFLSIIIPVYNTQIEKISKCVDSIIHLFEMSAEPMECIIVDDGSEYYINDFFKNTYKDEIRISYIRKDNGGASSARNVGIKNACGKYIMFVDADDVVIPESVNEMISLCDNYDIVISDLLFKCDKEIKKWKAIKNDCEGQINIIDVLFQLSIDGRLNGPVCKLFRRNFIIENDVLFPEDMVTGEDAVFFYRALNHEPKISYYSKITYIYNFDSSSAKGRICSNPENMLKCYVKMYIEFLSLINSSVTDISTKQLLLLSRTKQYIKQLFDFMLGVEENSKFTKNLLMHFFNDANLPNKINKNIVYKCDKSTRAKYFIIMNYNHVLNKVLLLFRYIYIGLKKYIMPNERTVMKKKNKRRLKAMLVTL